MDQEKRQSSGEGERRFVWPPRRAEQGAAAVANPAGPAGEAAEQAAREPPARPAPAAAARTGWRAGLLEIERVWLGLDTPPLTDRIAAAGWAPDAGGAYCGRCGLTVGPYESGPDGCPACRGRRLAWERAVRLGEYAGLIREVVQEVKFTRWRRLGDEIGMILGRSLESALGDCGHDPGAAVLVPIPPSFRRRMSRGIDHSLVIARGVSRQTGMPVVRCLAKSHRPSQLSVPTSRRRTNVAGSIRAREGVDLGGRLVVVLDDVMTTGATMTAAARAVAGSTGAVRVWAAVVGVTPVPGRRAGGDSVNKGGLGAE